MASPILCRDQVIFSGGALEHAQPKDPKYDCCYGRGFVMALNPRNGEIFWKYDVGPPPRLAASSPGLAVREPQLATDPLGAQDRLAIALRGGAMGAAPPLDELLVLIDCPPSLGILTLNALTAADALLIPLQCEYYALEGLARLMETRDLVSADLNPALELEGIVLTMVDTRNNLSRQVEAEVREHFADRVYRTRIPRNVRLSEAPSHGQPILLYDAHSRGAQAYLELAEEVISRHINETTPEIEGEAPPEDCGSKAGAPRGGMPTEEGIDLPLD